MASEADDLLDQLGQLGSEEITSTGNNTSKTKVSSTKTKTSVAYVEGEDNPFDDLEKQLAAKPATSTAVTGTSRPTTPRLSSSTTSGTNKSPKRADHTPASSGPPSGRNSEDRLRTAVGGGGRTSGERSYHQASTPGDEKKTEEHAAGGTWWGSVFSVASAAVKQAESLTKEIRKNEEAQRWADQVRGYGANLQHLSTNLRSQALPTFTTLISHIAPPISAHERLQIHITHDILNYPSLDPLIYETFSRVMAQVEGGDLLVIQRGTESRSRTSSEPQGYKGGMLGSGNGWTDGPWWRDEQVKRDLGAVPGLKEGTRLARVSAESHAKDFFDARGGIEEAAKRATQTLSESNPVRSSDIFLALQAITYTNDRDLFADSPQQIADDSAAEKTPQAIVVDPEDDDDDLVAFAVYLHDPIHSLAFSALSQPFPRKWALWLDADPISSSLTAAALPASILDMIHAGGVDPREWVAEWFAEILGLAVGVVAQRYVARRMGVGEGGLGRGKRRAEEDGLGGEAARAI